jgi:hypothetical protein
VRETFDESALRSREGYIVPRLALCVFDRPSQLPLEALAKAIDSILLCFAERDSDLQQQN